MWRVSLSTAAAAARVVVLLPRRRGRRPLPAPAFFFLWRVGVAAAPGLLSESQELLLESLEEGGGGLGWG